MNKFTKLILSASILILTATSGLFAQESQSNALDNKNAIGVYAMTPNIGGIQYERRFNDITSLKFDTYIYYSDETYVDPFRYNVNAEIDFTLFEAEWNEKSGSRLFVYGLLGNEGYITNNYNSDTQTYSKSKLKENIIASAGFGFDFIFFKHLSIPFQFGFIGNFPNDMSAGFCAGTGLRYSW